MGTEIGKRFWPVVPGSEAGGVENLGPSGTQEVAERRTRMNANFGSIKI